jgi:hypothetical protein
MTPNNDSCMGLDGLLDSVLRRLDRIEAKLDSIVEQVARITATCHERGELLRTMSRDIYGNGSPGLKTKASTLWMVLSGLGGGVIVLLGELIAAAIAKAF